MTTTDVNRHPDGRRPPYQTRGLRTCYTPVTTVATRPLRLDESSRVLTTDITDPSNSNPVTCRVSPPLSKILHR